jgi:antitoxin HigA-1
MIEKVSIAFESTANIASVFVGKEETLMKSKLLTTIKAPILANNSRSGKRLPTHRPPTHPGEMLLEEFLKPLEISQSQFAVRLGISFPRLNEIIHGKRGVTPDTALRLEQVLDMPADFWLGLQLDWDLWHAMRQKNAEAITKLVPLRHAG